MLNIVVPMAGAGSRFTREGYLDPKPLIPVNGVPMIQVVIRNLLPRCAHRFIFICQNSHIRRYDLIRRLQAWAPGCKIIGIDGLTEGAACTVLAAKSYINAQAPLMIANSDQYVDIDINEYLAVLSQKKLDGLIMTMKAHDPKWSFVKLNKKLFVSYLVEKEVISDEATVGIYNFQKGSDFVEAAELMIAQNERVNGEFYVAPVFNQLIKKGHDIGIFNVGKEFDGMYGLGTPSDLKAFLNMPIAQEVTGDVL